MIFGFGDDQRDKRNAFQGQALVVISASSGAAVTIFSQVLPTVAIANPCKRTM